MPVKELSTSQVISVSFDVIRWRLSDRLLFLRQQLDLQLLYDGVGDVVLDGEDIGQVTIIAVSPNMSAIFA